MNFTRYDEHKRPGPEEKKAMATFLFQHLEHFGDAVEDIEKAINYAIRETDSPGGFVLRSMHDDEITCVVVVAQTGMTGFVPKTCLFTLPPIKATEAGAWVKNDAACHGNCKGQHRPSR